jgi:hypothetical protein
MKHEFLSEAWFSEVDRLIAASGDLEIPPEMKAVEVNVTVTSPGGDKQVFIKDGMLYRGHRDGAPTSLTLDVALARKIFVEADMAAGVQAFLAGEMKVEGDLAKLVAMQTTEPSEPQKQLTQKIAAFTS